MSADHRNAQSPGPLAARSPRPRRQGALPPRPRADRAPSRACSNTSSADATSVCAGQRPYTRDRVPIICGSPDCGRGRQTLRSSLGVKGSQVQILSSRRVAGRYPNCRGAALTCVYARYWRSLLDHDCVHVGRPDVRVWSKSGALVFGPRSGVRVCSRTRTTFSAVRSG
jgi:hypothetical protein